LPIVKDDDDIWECEVKVNQAILELKRSGGGPVHINLPTTYTLPFEQLELPKYRVIDRFNLADELPILNGKVAVFIGAHKKWSTIETEALDKFCEVNDAVVFCDHTSGYKGRYRLLFSLASAQESMDKSLYRPDITIHIGEVTGDYSSLCMAGKQIWRVSEDGEIRDTFRRLRYVFEMPEINFFDRYSKGEKKSDGYFKSCKNILDGIRDKVPKLPLSNIWVASQIAPKLPNHSTLHFGILNSLRSWNFFEVPETVQTSSNVGGFGIDGVLSTLIGASFCKPDSLYFCVLGDLAFFYDMNVIGNRHVGNNVRILLINNGKGTEFRQYNHHAAYFKDDADKFIAAADHYGNKSPTLVKNYAENLGFEYISASNKIEFKTASERFLIGEVTKKPIILEVFTNSEEESIALESINTIIEDKKSKFKATTKKIIGDNNIKILKKLLRS
jgi:2-succinyl-5-enolpyruvyl-6-hydroxy-3-cyclohexene-1-carboxylate synthase